MLTHKEQFNLRHKFNKDESHSISELSKTTKIPIKILNEVFKRGIGAFKTNRQSVRPHVTSPEQWGYSRVYAFINKIYKKTLDFDIDLYKKSINKKNI
jgi:hypothetical protein